MRPNPVIRSKQKRPSVAGLGRLPTSIRAGVIRPAPAILEREGESPLIYVGDNKGMFATNERSSTVQGRSPSRGAG